MIEIHDLEIEQRTFDKQFVVTGVVADPCIDDPPTSRTTGIVVPWINRRRVTIDVFHTMSGARRFVKQKIFKKE